MSHQNTPPLSPPADFTLDSPRVPFPLDFSLSNTDELYFRPIYHITGPTGQSYRFKVVVQADPTTGKIVRWMFQGIETEVTNPNERIPESDQQSLESLVSENLNRHKYYRDAASCVVKGYMPASYNPRSKRLVQEYSYILEKLKYLYTLIDPPVLPRPKPSDP
jgi:hypothetical protein